LRAVTTKATASVLSNSVFPKQGTVIKAHELMSALGVG
jgi:hypothetical protein